MNFSVLMPIYIKENPVFFALSLDSILVNQTIKPTEVLIVEDGPLTPELDTIIQTYTARFPQQLKIYKLSENKGMGFAMNYGLKRCNYEWVFRMDSDDIAVADRFEKQIKIIETNQYDMIGSSIQEFKEKVGDLTQFRTVPESHSEIIKFMKFRCPFNHMTVAFKKSKALEAGGYWNNRHFEDYNLWYELMRVNSRFYNIQEPLVYARIGNNMLSRRRGYEYYKYELDLLQKFRRNNFINPLQYVIIKLVKFISRLVPINILTWLYTKFLRKEK
jgi:glycosyltransferase involved in cell wall biosynthesis